jgi:hypothetical protein
MISDKFCFCDLVFSELSGHIRFCPGWQF